MATEMAATAATAMSIAAGARIHQAPAATATGEDDRAAGNGRTQGKPGTGHGGILPIEIKNPAYAGFFFRTMIMVD